MKLVTFLLVTFACTSFAEGLLTSYPIEPPLQQHIGDPNRMQMEQHARDHHTLLNASPTPKLSATPIQ